MQASSLFCIFVSLKSMNSLCSLRYFSFHRMPDTVETNGEDATSSEEEKEDNRIDVNGTCRAEDCITQGDFHKELANSDLFVGQVNGSTYYHSDDEDDRDVGDNSVPTIFFSHTVEPKRVCTLFNFYLLLKRLHKICIPCLNLNILDL